MAYHEAFWTTGAEVAAAMLVATAVALSQSIDTQVQRVSEQPRQDDPTGSSEPVPRDRSLGRFYVYGITSLVVTVTSLLLSMICLLDESDVTPAWTGAVLLLGGVTLIFVQVFASAKVKLRDADLANTARHGHEDRRQPPCAG